MTLLNPNQVIASSKKARFQPPQLLDLDRLGIRSIKFWEEKGCFLILAGPVDTGSDFRLYRWSGEGRQQVDFARAGLPDGVAPESILIHAARSEVDVLFDEGRRKLNGVTVRRVPIAAFAACGWKACRR